MIRAHDWLLWAAVLGGCGSLDDEAPSSTPASEAALELAFEGEVYTAPSEGETWIWTALDWGEGELCVAYGRLEEASSSAGSAEGPVPEPAYDLEALPVFGATAYYDDAYGLVVIYGTMSSYSAGAWVPFGEYTAWPYDVPPTVEVQPEAAPGTLLQVAEEQEVEYTTLVAALGGGCHPLSEATPAPSEAR